MNSGFPKRPRTGFTLIELIVVITIILILLGITASAVNFSLNAEKVGGAARQVQSYLAGARDRAIHAGEPRGVRFIRTTNPVSGASLLADASDPADPNLRTVNSLMFVGPSEPWTEGRIQLERQVASPTLATVVAAQPSSGWFELAARNTLHSGLRIRIPNDRSGSWYTIVGFLNTTAWPATVGGTGTVPPVFDPQDNDTSNDDPFPLKVVISPPYRDPADRPVPPAGNWDPRAFRELHPNTYNLELPNVILPERPVILPKGTVIDLDGSDVPTNWQGLAQGSIGTSAPGYFDVMFSPRGTVTGDAASRGILHFYITTMDGVALSRAHLFDTVLPNVSPASPFPLIPGDDIPIGGGEFEPVGDRALVSVFTKTGAVSAHPIDVTDLTEDRNGNGTLDPGEDTNGNGSLDSNLDGIADDPYFFAETGEVADQ